jgi:hypothetical protein
VQLRGCLNVVNIAKQQMDVLNTAQHNQPLTFFAQYAIFLKYSIFLKMPLQWGKGEAQTEPNRAKEGGDYVDEIEQNQTLHRK